MKEADLYPDLKAYLEAQGYVVKGEVGACDILARRGQEPAVVVEMKLSFSLALVMQGVARAAVLMRADHYGWFERVSTGIYALTPKGQAAMLSEAAEIARLGGQDASV